MAIDLTEEIARLERDLAQAEFDRDLSTRLLRAEMGRRCNLTGGVGYNAAHECVCVLGKEHSSLHWCGCNRRWNVFTPESRQAAFDELAAASDAFDAETQ